MSKRPNYSHWPKVGGYRTLAEYKAEEVFPFVGFGFPSFLVLVGFQPVWVKGHSVRLECFKRRPFCAECGKRGMVFRLQVNNGPTPHLNLYHVTKRGHYVLMTKDHKVPKSRGGPDTIGNMQTMCSDCNHRKGDIPYRTWREKVTGKKVAKPEGKREI